MWQIVCLSVFGSIYTVLTLWKEEVLRLESLIQNRYAVGPSGAWYYGGQGRCAAERKAMWAKTRMLRDRLLGQTLAREVYMSNQHQSGSKG